MDMVKNLKPIFLDHVEQYRKGKPERCFKDIPLRESYELFYQPNSWCTDDQFVRFLSFLPKDKKYFYCMINLYMTTKIVIQ